MATEQLGSDNFVGLSDLYEFFMLWLPNLPQNIGRNKKSDGEAKQDQRDFPAKLRYPSKRLNSEASTRLQLIKMKDQYNDVMSKTSVPEFIAKIYSILEKNEFQDIISWSQNCSEIHIKNPKALQDEVLPIYFRHRKIESFIRQLNMYRFSKVNKLNKEKYHMFFKNQLFKKGNIDALSLIKRKKKGLVEDTTEASDDNEAQSLENYKQFVKENVFLIQEQLLKVRKNHPEMNSQLAKIFQYSNLIVGQDLNHNVLTTIPEIKTRHNFFQTYKEIFQLASIHHFNSKCSIQGQINQPDFN